MCALIMNLVTLIIEQQLQSARHAAAELVDVREVGGLPLLTDELFQLFHRLRETSIHSRLQLAPEVLNGVEVRTPWRPLEPGHSFAVQVGDCLRGRVKARVVLLEDPRASGGELLEGGDET